MISNFTLVPSRVEKGKRDLGTLLSTGHDSVSIPTANIRIFLENKWIIRKNISFAEPK